MSPKDQPARFRAVPRPSAPSDRDPPARVAAFRNAVSIPLLCLAAVFRRPRMSSVFPVFSWPGGPRSIGLSLMLHGRNNNRARSRRTGNETPASRYKDGVGYR
jgi:hypothetical protein